jgi:nucleoid-associated protein YgaU
MRVNKNSRLWFADLVEIGDVTFWTRPDIPEIPVSSDDEWYTVKRGERIDGIAKKKLGDQSLWYVIAHVNNLFLLPSELRTGLRLRIPSPKSIRETLRIK